MNTSRQVVERKSPYKNFIGQIFEAIASMWKTDVELGTYIADWSRERKDTQRSQIEQYLYDAVYLEGMSLEDVIQLYPQLYKKNKKLFVQVYNSMDVKRRNNGLNINTQTIVIGVVILIVVILIIRKI